MAGTGKAGVVTPEVNQNVPLVNQIYPIVNSIFTQMTGRDDIQAVDTNSLVAMGAEIGNLGKRDIWLNTLARRIAGTIDTWKVYRNKMADLYRNNIEWGAAMQKITAEMPEAVSDPSFDIGAMDGQSVDHYIINNPRVHQRIFEKNTPYAFFITISTRLLRDAFLSEEAMQSFINQIFGKVRNKIEFTLEELGRMAVANFILNLKSSQEFHLVSIYNGLKNTSLTSDAAKFDADFLRWVTGFIGNISAKMENMSVLYNSDKFDRFTSVSDQRLYMLADFMTQLRTVVSYSAFNSADVKITPNNLVPYWQASGTAVNMGSWTAMTSIKGTKCDGAARNVTNLIGVLFDREAIGTFRQEDDVLTTPVNARARYYNTFWHESQLWFNDMSENGVAFYLD